MDPPQEVVLGFFLTRHTEAVHDDPGRVDAGHHGADHAVLAAGIHRLQHDEQGSPPLGEESLLQLGDRIDIHAEPVLGGRLLPAERLVGVVVVEVHDPFDSHRRDDVGIGCGHGRTVAATVGPTSGHPNVDR